MASPAASGSELERRLAALEDEVRASGEIVRRVLVQSGAVQEGQPDPEQDVPVICRCGTLAGFYDPKTELVRVRHQAHLVYMRMGPGGLVSVVCRKCSAMVELTYREPDDVSAVEVRGGLIVLDVKALTRLLSTALEAGSGQVTLRAVTTA